MCLSLREKSVELRHFVYNLYLLRRAPHFEKHCKTENKKSSENSDIWMADATEGFTTSADKMAAHSFIQYTGNCGTALLYDKTRT